MSKDRIRELAEETEMWIIINAEDHLEAVGAIEQALLEARQKALREARDIVKSCRLIVSKELFEKKDFDARYLVSPTQTEMLERIEKLMEDK